MAALSPYILAGLSGLFALIGWYIRENQKQHADLAKGINGGIDKLSNTFVGLESRLEDQIADHSRRFERYTVSMERRMTEVETRCSYQHGETPDRRKPREHQLIDWQQASDVGVSNKSNIKPSEVVKRHDSDKV